MSFKKNINQQLSFDDTYIQQSDRAKAYLKKSWAHGFSQLIFPRINEERFSILYSDKKFSRPNTPVNVIIGALILKEVNQLTDDDLLESILFDIRYQYALHTTSFKEQPFSDRTLSRFRERLLRHESETGEDLLKDEMLAMADIFAHYMGMDMSKKRMDSLMIATNCRKMSQMDLLYTCIENLLKYISKKNDLYLVSEFEHYICKNNRNDIIYKAKTDEIHGKMIKLAEDGYILLKKLSEKYADSEAYKLLNRCINEQIKITEGKIEVKSSKEINSSTLQTPFDSDATYRLKSGKRHYGYIGNVVETVDKTNNSHTSLITDFDYQKNTYDDSRFCKNVLEKIDNKNQKTWLVSDGAFFSVKNIELAIEKNIELVTSAVIGTAPNILFTDFKIDKTKNLIIKCPAGHIPSTTKFYGQHGSNVYSNKYRLTFPHEACGNCSNKNICNVKIRKKKSVVEILENTIKRAEYVKKISSVKYQQLINFRAGIEGIPSVLRRKYKIDYMPVRGYTRTKLWYNLKIGAINVLKMLAAVALLKDFPKFPVLRDILLAFFGFSQQIIRQLSKVQYHLVQAL